MFPVCDTMKKTGKWGIIMNGLERNVARLFSNEGKLFAMAMDLPQCGLVDGLEDPVSVIRARKDSKLDAFLINPGVARLAEKELLHKKIILRTSANEALEAAHFHCMMETEVNQP